MSDEVDKKVSLLYDLCILMRAKTGDKDAREKALREVLARYTTDRQLDIALHNVVRGDITLNTFLAQKGVQ